MAVVLVALIVVRQTRALQILNRVMIVALVPQKIRGDPITKERRRAAQEIVITKVEIASLMAILF
jgi:hypothetical protein